MKSTIPYQKTTKSKLKDDALADNAKNTIIFLPKYNEELYAGFRSDFQLFVDKVGAGPAKASVQLLLDRELIFIMKHLTNVKNGILAGSSFKNNRLAGVFLDLIELDIDPKTGKTSTIDDCFYAVYYQMVRSAVIIHEKEITKDIKLHTDLVSFLFYVLLKIIKVNISSKQKVLLMIIASYFFYKYYLKNNHNQALENTFKIIDTPIKDEISSKLTLLEKYTKFEDIWKAIVDFDISNDAPTKLTVQAIMLINMASYYLLSTSIDTLCGLAVISRYPFSITSAVSSLSNIQPKIEKAIQPYINRVEFDTTYISSLKTS